MESILGFIWNACLFVILIGFVALIHEFGHFFVAKLCNVRVDAFAIGMGSTKLWSKTIGETEYSVRIFPIGGFVLLAQENGEEEEGKPDPGDRGFMAKPLWQKILILLAGPGMNILGTFSILFFILVWFGQSLTTLYVFSVSENSAALQAGLQAGDVIRSIQGHEISDFDKGKSMIGNYSKEEMKVEVERRTDYTEFQTVSELETFIQSKFQSGNFIRVYTKKENPTIFLDPAKALLFLKTKEPGELKFDASQRIEKIVLQVPAGKTGKIGVGIHRFYLDGKIKTVPFQEALVKSLEMTIVGTQRLILQIFDMFSNFVMKFALPKEIGGPIAIANVVSMAAETGAYEFFNLAAMICLSIGIFNLVPIPGLDGGRISVLLLKAAINQIAFLFRKEKKEVFDDVIEGYINWFGVFCVLGLIILVTFKDLRDLLR